MADGTGAGGDGPENLSRMSDSELFRAFLGAEMGYATTAGPEKQRWFDRRAAIAAELKSRLGQWPEPKRTAGDPQAYAYKIPTSNDLKTFSETQLMQAFVDNARAYEAVEHIGRKNRLIGIRFQIVEELKARGDARSNLERLKKHSDPEVRASAGSYLDWLDKPRPEPAPRRPLRAEVLWQCDHPPPPTLTRAEITEYLRRHLPEAPNRLTDLLLRAIGLWPQRRGEIAVTASRFGGTPLAPPGWQWPVADEEPRLFVGQINCAEFCGLPGAEALPPSGLLAFFGDHDAVTGCFPFDADCVFYWPDVDRLVAAAPAIEPLEVFPSCAIVPRPCLDLPHPLSGAVGRLGLTKQTWRSYFDAWIEVHDHAIPRECVPYAKCSKLFGWPDLVQSDLQQLGSGDDARLLLQVEDYCNGEELHVWGPGGSLYYSLSERDLRAGLYEKCEFEGQFT